MLKFVVTFLTFPFSELNLVESALDVVDLPSSFSAVTLLGHLTHKIVSEITYNMSSGTLNPTMPYLHNR